MFWKLGSMAAQFSCIRGCQSGWGRREITRLFESGEEDRQLGEFIYSSVGVRRVCSFTREESPSMGEAVNPSVHEPVVHCS